MAENYLLLTGLDYVAPDGKQVRAEADDLVDDLPEEALEWLLVQGLVTPEYQPSPDEPTIDGEADSSLVERSKPPTASSDVLDRHFGPEKAPDRARKVK